MAPAADILGDFQGRGVFEVGDLVIRMAIRARWRITDTKGQRFPMDTVLKDFGDVGVAFAASGSQMVMTER